MSFELPQPSSLARCGVASLDQAYSFLVRGGYALLDYETWLACHDEHGRPALMTLYIQWRTLPEGAIPEELTFSGYCRQAYRDYVYCTSEEQDHG